VLARSFLAVFYFNFQLPIGTALVSRDAILLARISQKVE